MTSWRSSPLVLHVVGTFILSIWNHFFVRMVWWHISAITGQMICRLARSLCRLVSYLCEPLETYPYYFTEYQYICNGTDFTFTSYSHVIPPMLACPFSRALALSLSLSLSLQRLTVNLHGKTALKQIEDWLGHLD